MASGFVQNGPDRCCCEKSCATATTCCSDEYNIRTRLNTTKAVICRHPSPDRLIDINLAFSDGRRIRTQLSGLPVLAFERSDIMESAVQAGYKE